MGKAARRIVALLAFLSAATVAIAGDDCAARCRAIEAQCLKANQGDTARCNAVVTQCYQSCRKPK